MSVCIIIQQHPCTVTVHMCVKPMLFINWGWPCNQSAMYICLSLYELLLALNRLRVHAAVKSKYGC